MSEAAFSLSRKVGGDILTVRADEWDLFTHRLGQVFGDAVAEALLNTVVEDQAARNVTATFPTATVAGPPEPVTAPPAAAPAADPSAEPAGPGQLKVLQSLGVDAPAGLTKDEAARLIKEARA